MQLFKTKKVSLLTISELLRQFAIDLDKNLKQRISGINNGPEKSRYDLGVGVQRLAKLVNCKDFLQTITPNELIHGSNQREPTTSIRLASINAIKNHYRNIAEITLNDTIGNCVGLSAVCLQLAQELLEQNEYRGIEVQMCQLSNWQHVLIRLSYRGQSPGLFYDPWFQYWQNQTPNTLILIEESEFSVKMKEIVAIRSRNNIRPIQHIRTFADYNSRTKHINFNHFILNYQLDFSYFIICSTGSFSNPARKIPEPQMIIDMEPGPTCVIL